MLDYSLEYTMICVWCENKSAVYLSKTPIQNSRSKHIDIRHHFIRYHAQKGNIELKFIEIKLQLADILIKPLNKDNINLLNP